MHGFAGLAQQARCFAVEGGQLLAAQLPPFESDHAIGEIATTLLLASSASMALTQSWLEQR